jgi:hypothetical protein
MLMSSPCRFDYITGDTKAAAVLIAANAADLTRGCSLVRPDQRASKK